MANRTPPSNTDRTPTPNVPVGDGDGTPTGDGVQTDPAPAASPVASAEPSARDGDRAGAGRPTRKRKDRTPAKRKSMIPAMSADLAMALLDASAEVWRTDNALRIERVRSAAVGFVDGIRHAGGEAP